MEVYGEANDVLMFLKSHGPSTVKAVHGCLGQPDHWGFDYTYGLLSALSCCDLVRLGGPDKNGRFLYNITEKGESAITPDK